MPRFAMHLALYACLWVFLTGGGLESWVVGGPAVVLAAAAGVALAAPRRSWRWSALGLARFVPFFAGSSLLSGVDVAWRSLDPRLPIHPQLIDYAVRLPDGAARTFFMSAINLLPGTVCADVRGAMLTVHVMDGRRPVHQQLARLERAVAALFAVELGAELHDSGGGA